jgi:hypothetical protein
MAETKAETIVRPETKDIPANGELFLRVLCEVQNAEFYEIAVWILARHERELDETARQKGRKIAEDKPKFSYWTHTKSDYDLEYALAMELGRLQVFKGTVADDRDQYRLACRLNKGRPDLVGVNLFDYRRQFRVFLSQRALAMRRFALVEMARQD